MASGYTGGTPSSENFSFDNTGNRTGSGVSVDKNRLLSDGTYNYTYDGEGNRTSRTNITTTETILYSWDHRNRLTKVEYRNTPTGPATKIVANTYDAFDRRVMKQVDANGDGDFTDTNDRTERYVWDGGQISLVLDANGAVLHRFLHGPAIDQVFADEDSVHGLLWDLGDNQNTTRDVIDNSGTVVNHLTYSPFGVIASESDTTKTPFAAYTGRDWDEDLNLQYNRGRWYEPASGRWLSEDPIRFSAGDTNLQRYVGNAPTNATDPSGLEVEGYNHFYPLFLGGDPKQPLFELTQKQHTAFHDFLRHNLLQGGQADVDWDQARENWKKLSENKKRNMIREGMRHAEIDEATIKAKLDDIMKNADAGANRTKERLPKERVPDKCSKADLDKARKAEAQDGKHRASPKTKPKVGDIDGPRVRGRGPLKWIIGLLPAMGYLWHGDVGGAAQELAPEDPLDLINPLGTSELGRGSEITNEEIREREIQNALPAGGGGAARPLPEPSVDLP